MLRLLRKRRSIKSLLRRPTRRPERETPMTVTDQDDHFRKLIAISDGDYDEERAVEILYDNETATFFLRMHVCGRMFFAAGQPGGSLSNLLEVTLAHPMLQRVG